MVLLLLFIVVVLVSSVVGYKTARISLRTNEYKNRIRIDSYVSNRINRRTYRVSSIYSSNSDETLSNEDVESIRKKIDTEFITVALPAFIGLVAEPLIAIVGTHSLTYLLTHLTTYSLTHSLRCFVCWQAWCGVSSRNGYRY